MWGQSEESIKAWLHRIRNKRIQAPVRYTVLTIHHPHILEASTLPNKKISYKNDTKLDLPPLELLHNIDMMHAGRVHCNLLKPVLVRLTQHHPFLCASPAYELK